MTFSQTLKHHLLAALCVLLGATIWLWPLTGGPLPAAWPNIVAWAVGLVLLNALYRLGEGQKTGAIAFGWILAALISAVIAVIQYFNFDDSLYPFVATTAPGYAYGNTRQPNHLATLLGAGLLSLIWAVTAQRIRHSIALWIACMLAIAMAATASRTGGIHMMLVGVVAIWWAGPQRRKFFWSAVGIACVYAISAVALPLILQWSLGIEGRDLMWRLRDESLGCSSRKVLWGNVLHLISLKPWAGWGWGELVFAHFTTLFEGPRFCEKLTNAHNLPLHLAVELGIPIAALICLGLIWLIWLKQPWHAKTAEHRLAYSVLGLIGVHSLLEYPLWFGNFQAMVILCGVLLWPLDATDKATPRTYSRTLAQKLAFWSFFLMSVLGYVAWDYFRVSQLYLPRQDRASQYRDDTLSKARNTWLFSSHVLFAQVVTSELDSNNAAALLQASLAALHVSPEPRVFEKIIDSAQLLNLESVADEYITKYRAASPDSFSQWSNSRLLRPD